MKKNSIGFILFLSALILLIPAFSLIGQGGRPDAPETPVSSSGSTPLPPSGTTGLDSLKKEDYDSGNFYLVLNHTTGEVMALAPLDYITGVVAAEMPASYHPEALKAQAVAAHSYALRQIGEQLSNPDPALNGAYLSTDPDHFQAWISTGEMQELWGDAFSANYRKLSGAVTEVIDHIVTYGSEPIAAAFHAISSGRTESAATVWGREVGYLEPVDSEGDELSPDYEVTVQLRSDEISHALTAVFPTLELPEDKTKWFDIKQRSDSGTVTQVAVGNLTLSGREVREAFKLKSADFTVSYENNAFTFVTLGYGHDVGMSQYGADYLARQGKTWQEIVKHYYTGVEIIEIQK